MELDEDGRGEPNGKTIISHCANTGSMEGLLIPGSPLLLTQHPERPKLKYSWQAVKIGPHWVGVNTSNPNKLVKNFILSGGLRDGLGVNEFVRAEVPISKESRCDLIARDERGREVYIEVKNTTSKVEHEASTSKIGEDQIFYCKQRGLSTEDAVNMIVNGFCKEVFRELPMEFAVEAQKLLGVSLEGSVG